MPKEQTPEEKRKEDALRLREWRARKRAEYIAANGEPPKRGRPRVAFEVQAEKKKLREEKYREQKRLEKPPKPPKPEKLKPEPKQNEKIKVSSVVENKIFPAESILAAATNQAHGFTTVLATGQTEDSRKIVIIERIRTLTGFYLFRVKTTTYAFYNNKTKALAAAKAEKVKLSLYSSFTEFSEEDEN